MVAASESDTLTVKTTDGVASSDYGGNCGIGAGNLNLSAVLNAPIWSTLTLFKRIYSSIYIILGALLFFRILTFSILYDNRFILEIAAISNCFWRMQIRPNAICQTWRSFWSQRIPKTHLLTCLILSIREAFDTFKGKGRQRGQGFFLTRKVLRDDVKTHGSLEISKIWRNQVYD